MDLVTSLKLKMEKSLEVGNLEETLSHLDDLISSTSSSSELSYLLVNHCVKSLPTLHHLARFRFQEEDIPHLNKLIKMFTDFDYDINKTTVRYRSRKGPTSGFTALLASIEHRNHILTKCLLEHGARTDIRDLDGYSSYHWAIMMGDLKCLELLVEFGGTSVVASIGNSRVGKAHPLLHTVVVKGRVEILEYLLCKPEFGLNVNSVSDSKISMVVNLMGRSDVLVTLSSFTLLHLACVHEAEEVIKVLVEEAGADINCKTEGDWELTPVHILLAMEQWKSAQLLIEKGADLNVRGRFKEEVRFSRVMRKNLATGDLELNSTPNAVELLVRMGCDEGLPLLDQVLARPDVVWQGAEEFHLAVEGGNLVYISKVLQHCGKSISKEDLCWLTYCEMPGEATEEVPTLLHLLRTLRLHSIFNEANEPALVALAEIIRLLVTLGYNLNLNQTDSLSRREPILDHVFAIDSFQESSNLLLGTILQVDHFQLNLPEIQHQSRNRGFHPVNWKNLLRLWSIHCAAYDSRCWDNKPLPHSIVEAVKLLVTHGLEVTGMVIDHEYTYHFGCNVILKMLYCAGAKISDQFLTSPRICTPGHPETQEFHQEIAEVKQWKDEFDRKELCSLNTFADCVFGK